MHWALHIPRCTEHCISHDALSTAYPMMHTEHCISHDALNTAYPMMVQEHYIPWYITYNIHREHIQLAQRTINHTRCNLSQNALRLNGHLAAAGSLWVAVGWRGQSVSWGGAGQWWTSPWLCHWAVSLGQSWGCPSVDLNNNNGQLTAFHLSIIIK